MDNFDYKAYLRNNPLLQPEDKLIKESEDISEKKYKQGYDDREDESLGARRGAEKGKKQSFKDRRDDSYGKFGKRDAEAKGKDKGPGKNRVNKEGLAEKKEDSKKGNKEEQKRMEGAIRDDRDHIKALEKDIADNEKKLAKLKKDFKDDVNEEMDKKYEEDDVKKEEMSDEKKRMKVSELKAKIREQIIAQLTEEEEIDEQEDVDVEDNVDVDVERDVNVDVEDEVDVDDKSVESDIEVKTAIPGESSDVEAVLGLLTKAQAEAEKIGDPKLLDQIGNTITFFTRKHVVASAD
jgi:hypothetical protein|tara:strand:+ start:358 stop:1236 length:879 start_codon:yes stop_codon:yes gene_type:complete